jgi:hypothetical protein
MHARSMPSLPRVLCRRRCGGFIHGAEGWRFSGLGPPGGVPRGGDRRSGSGPTLASFMGDPTEARTREARSLSIEDQASPMAT